MESRLRRPTPSNSRSRLPLSAVKTPIAPNKNAPSAQDKENRLPSSELPSIEPGTPKLSSTRVEAPPSKVQSRNVKPRQPPAGQSAPRPRKAVGANTRPAVPSPARKRSVSKGKKVGSPKSSRISKRARRRSGAVVGAPQRNPTTPKSSARNAPVASSPLARQTSTVLSEVTIERYDWKSQIEQLKKLTRHKSLKFTKFDLKSQVKAYRYMLDLAETVINDDRMELQKIFSDICPSLVTPINPDDLLRELRDDKNISASHIAELQKEAADMARSLIEQEKTIEADLKKHAAAIAEAENDLEEEKSDRLEEQREAESMIVNLENECVRLRDTIEAELKKHAAAIAEAENDLKKEQSDRHEEQREAASMIVNLENEKSSLENRLVEEGKRVAAELEELEGARTKEIKLFNKKIDEIEAELVRSRAAEKAQQDQVAQLNEKIQSQAAEVTAYQDEKQVTDLELRKERNKTVSLEYDVSDIKTRLERADRRNLELAEARDEAEKKLETKRSGFNAKVDQLQDEIDQRRDELHDTKESMSRSTREHTTTICLLGEKHKMDLNRVKQESAVEMKAAERVKHDLEAQIEVLQGKTDRLSKQVAEYDCSVQERMGELNKAEGEVGKLQDMLKTQREKLKDDRVRLEEELAVKEGRYRNIQDELRREIQSTVAMRDERDKISLELKEAMNNMGSQAETSQSQRDQIRRLKESNAEQAKEIRNLGGQLETLDMRCKKLNEQVCILKGTIRVMIRVRPLLTEAEKSSGNGHLSYSFDEEGRDQICITNDRAVNSSISVDKVIRDSATQESVFTEIQSMIQSALDGHNVCLFAYGQTGSGKTFSMEGPETGINDDTEGLIPRSMKHLLDEASKSVMWNYSFQSNYIEIYCDRVYDLLSKSTTETKARLIKDHPVVYDPALKTHSIETISDIYQTIKKASNGRRTASTDFNTRSSRSHAIFIVNITGEHVNGTEKLSSTIQLIDLAGSECAKDSGAYQGQGKLEASAINQSLSSLTRVINGLQDKKAHVNFRDCKLTGILEPALTKTAKVLMMVHLNPSRQQVSQSLYSAKFAQSANATKVGKKNKPKASQSLFS